MYPGEYKKYCGTYKGFRIYAVGEIIGSNWYGDYYASRKRKKNYVKIVGSECSTWGCLKARIDSGEFDVE